LVVFECYLLIYRRPGISLCDGDQSQTECKGNPTLYRVQDPAFKLAVKSRKSFTVNIGDIIREAGND
jgi:hypothetical protein